MDLPVVNVQLTRATVAVLGGALLLSACSSTNYSGVELRTGIAQLDESSQTIVWPVSRFTATMPERQAVSTAADKLVSECGAKQGYQWPIIDRRQMGDEDAWERPYGLWSIEHAAQYGYEAPPFSETKQQLIDFGRDFSQEEDEVFWACQDGVEAEQPLLDLSFLDDNDNLVQRARAESYHQASATPEWEQAVEQWRTCITAAGYAPREDEPFGLVGTENFGTEQRIRAAVADTRCKQDTDLVQRLADIEASFQLKFIEQNEAALIAQREKINESLKYAESILNE